MTTNNGALSNAELTEACFKDLLDPSIWGYGTKRIYIGPDIVNSFPNNYSGFGYKNEQGTLMIGLRWNKYPHYAPKFVSYNKGDDIMERWDELIKLFQQQNSTS